MPRVGHRKRAGAFALALAMVVSACGGGDGNGNGKGTEATGEEIEVVADEYSFAPSRKIPAGDVSIRLVNEGKEQHKLVFSKINPGYTLQDAIALKEGSAEPIGVLDAAPGRQSAAYINASLGPGKYAMACPLQTADGKPHYELGQKVQFEIK